MFFFIQRMQPPAVFPMVTPEMQARAGIRSPLGFSELLVDVKESFGSDYSKKERETGVRNFRREMASAIMNASGSVNRRIQEEMRLMKQINPRLREYEVLQRRISLNKRLIQRYKILMSALSSIKVGGLPGTALEREGLLETKGVNLQVFERNPTTGRTKVRQTIAIPRDYAFYGDQLTWRGKLTLVHEFLHSAISNEFELDWYLVQMARLMKAPKEYVNEYLIGRLPIHGPRRAQRLFDLVELRAPIFGRGRERLPARGIDAERVAEELRRRREPFGAGRLPRREFTPRRGFLGRLLRR